MGKGSNANERRYGETISTVLQGKRKFVAVFFHCCFFLIWKVEEGSELPEFWDVLGGKCEYAFEGYLHERPQEPRLFQCSNATGQFLVEEIMPFSQDDLDINDIFILDTFNELYVWVGEKSNDTEKKMAFETAIAYVTTAEDGRSPDTPIIRVTSGYEPKMFTCHFLGWNPKK